MPKGSSGISENFKEVSFNYLMDKYHDASATDFDIIENRGKVFYSSLNKEYEKLNTQIQEIRDSVSKSDFLKITRSFKENTEVPPHLEKYKQQYTELRNKQLDISSKTYITGYVGTATSWTINNYLRSGQSLDKYVQTHNKYISGIPSTTAQRKMIADSYKKVINTMDKNMKPIKENITVYRNVRSDYIKKVFGGTENFNKVSGIKVTEKGYISTSAEKSLNVLQKRDYKMKINIPKGTKVYVTKNKAESEVIINRNAKYKINGIKTTTNSKGKIKYTIDATIIP